jgi:hypothetical protein
MEPASTPKNQIIPQELESYSRFRRVLRKPDQLVLDDLFNAAQKHAGLAQYAPHALPFEIMLLTMLLEEHKAVLKLKERLEASRMTQNNATPGGVKAPQTADTIPGTVDPGIGFDDVPDNPDRQYLP